MNHKEYIAAIAACGRAKVLIRTKRDFDRLASFISRTQLVFRLDHISRVPFDWPTVQKMLQPGGLAIPGSVGGWREPTFFGAVSVDWSIMPDRTGRNCNVEYIAITSLEEWQKNWHHASVTEMLACAIKWLNPAMIQNKSRRMHLERLALALGGSQ